MDDVVEQDAERAGKRESGTGIPVGEPSGRRADAARAWCLGLLLVWGLVVPRVRGAEPDLAPFRLGFSSSTFGEINENDAVAAVKIWSKVLAEDQSLPLDPQPRVLRTQTEVRRALEERSLDALNLTTDEYWAFREWLAEDHCILGIQGEQYAEEYLLLVRADRRVESLLDLRQSRLAIMEGPRMRIAPIWLESVLLEGRHGLLTNFFRSIGTSGKLTRVVLPVFFRQIDACLVTRRGFGVMAELNPQVGRDLKPVLVSPRHVPYLFAFRRDYASPVRERVLAQLKGWHGTPSGRQILTLFQCDRVEDHPASDLAATLALIKTHAALRAGEASASAPTSARGDPAAK